MSCQDILPADPAVINQRLTSVEAEMKKGMTAEGFRQNQVEFRRFLTMRYRRQTAGVEMPISWDRFSPKRLTEIQDIFEKKYEELYGVGAGYAKAGIEISEIRVDAVGKVAKPRLTARRRKKSDLRATRKGKREIYFTRPERKFIETPVYDYERLGVGDVVKGPAVIELPFTTTLVPPGYRITVDPYLNLVMEIR
jgi:N-methylhydantoinase A